jgi:hypothetical protein
MPTDFIERFTEAVQKFTNAVELAKLKDRGNAPTVQPLRRSMEGNVSQGWCASGALLQQRSCGRPEPVPYSCR